MLKWIAILTKITSLLKHSLNFFMRDIRNPSLSWNIVNPFYSWFYKSRHTLLTETKLLVFLGRSHHNLRNLILGCWRFEPKLWPNVLDSWGQHRSKIKANNLRNHCVPLEFLPKTRTSSLIRMNVLSVLNHFTLWRVREQRQIRLFLISSVTQDLILRLECKSSWRMVSLALHRNTIFWTIWMHLKRLRTLTSPNKSITLLIVL